MAYEKAKEILWQQMSSQWRQEQEDKKKRYAKQQAQARVAAREQEAQQKYTQWQNIQQTSSADIMGKSAAKSYGMDAKSYSLLNNLESGAIPKVYTRYTMFEPTGSPLPGQSKERNALLNARQSELTAERLNNLSERQDRYISEINTELQNLMESAQWPEGAPVPGDERFTEYEASYSQIPETAMGFNDYAKKYNTLPSEMKNAYTDKAVQLWNALQDAENYRKTYTGASEQYGDQKTMYDDLAEYYRMPEAARERIRNLSLRLETAGAEKNSQYSLLGLDDAEDALSPEAIDYLMEQGLSKEEAKKREREIAISYGRYDTALVASQIKENAYKEVGSGAGNAVWANAKSIGANVANSFFGVIGTNQVNDSRYSTANPNSPFFAYGNYASAVRGKTKEQIETAVPGFGGKILSTLYSGGMFSIDNGLRILIGGETGSLALAGLSSFSDGFQEATERGGNELEAILFGGASAALEIVTEKISLDRLLKETNPKTIREIVTSALKQGAVEVSEEEASYFGGLIADYIIMGDKSQFNDSIRTYMAEGMSFEDAQKKALDDNMEAFVRTAAESMVAGAMMAGVTQTKRYAWNANQGRTLSENERQALLSQAGKLQDTESNRMAGEGNVDSRNAYFGALQGQVQQDISRRITGAETAEELFNLYREAIAETTPGVEAAADLAFMGRAQEMGQDVGDSAAAYATGAQIERQNRQSTGESWVDLILRRQYTADSAVERILNNESFRQEFAEKTGVEVPEVTLKGKNRSPQADINQAKRIVTNAIRNQEQRTQAYRDVYQKNDATAQETAPEAQTGEAEERPLSAVSRENVTTPLPSPVSARVSGGEEAVEITGIKFRDGQMVAETSGGDFTLPELSISAGDKMGQVLNIAAGYGGNIARNFLSNYDGETGPKTYWDAYNAFFSAGKLAAGTETMTFERAAAVNDAYARVLPQRAQMEAFSVGRESARAEEQAVKAAVKKARKGQGTVEDKTTKKTPEQDSIVKLLGAYAKRTGIDVTILDSIRKGDAKANGSFVAATMSMYLSSEADNVLQTLGHESGEFISAFAPEEKAAIRDTVLKWWAYHENLNAVDQLIRKYQEQYKKAEGSKTYNQAADEAINDALGALLTTETGQKQFVDWISKDNTMDSGKKKSLVQSIKNAVRKILDGLNEYLKRKGVSEETRRFLKMEVSQQEKIMKQFFHALDVAVENARETGEYVEETSTTAKGQKNTTQEGGEAYSIVDNNGKRYVQAEEKVLWSDNPKAWEKQLENYINNEIRKGKDILFPTDDGHILALTGRSAYKLSDRHKAKIAGKARDLLSDGQYAIKARAASQIDELIQVARYSNHRADETGKHENDIGEDGFNYYKAFFRDSDGKYYRVKFSSAINGEEETVYSIGDIVRRELPHNGSSTGKGGALNGGELSSDPIIYQSSGDSQEKSSVQEAFERAKSKTAGQYSLPISEEAERIAASGEDGAGEAQGTMTDAQRLKTWEEDFRKGESARNVYRSIMQEVSRANNAIKKAAKNTSAQQERTEAENALQEKTNALEKLVVYLKGQTKLTKGPLLQDATSKIAGELIEKYHAENMDASAVSGRLQEIYKAMKSKEGFQGAMEKAMELARDMVDSAYSTEGSLYENNKTIRTYLRENTVTISAEDVEGGVEAFRKLKKNNFGRVRIGVSENRSTATVGNVYDMLEKAVPDLLPQSGELSTYQKLLAITDAMELIYGDRGGNPYSGNEAETIGQIALDAVQGISTAQFEKATFADKMAQQKVDALERANKKAQDKMDALRKATETAYSTGDKIIQQLKADLIASRAEYGKALESSYSAEEGIRKSVSQVNELRNSLNQKKSALMKQAGKSFDEGMEKESKEGVKKKDIKAEKARFEREISMIELYESQLDRAEAQLQNAKNRLSNYNERKARDQYIRSVWKRRNRLTDKIVKNDTKTYMPEVFKRDIGEFLMSLDFTSSSFNKKGELTERDRRYTNSLEKLNYTIMNLGREGADTDGILLHIPDEFTKEIEKHIEKVRESTKDIDLGTSQVYAMTSQQLKKLDEILATLENAVNRSNELIGNARFKRVNEMSGSDIRTMDRLGPDKVRGKTRGRTSSFLRWEMATPSTAFRRFGEGGSSIMDEYVDGQAKVAFMDKEVMDFSQKTFTDKEKDSWRKKTRTYTLESGKKVQLTDAMVMSLYESEKRVHALGHLYGGGIVVAPDENIKVSQKRPFLLTEKDVSEICKTVKSDPRQRRVADAIQHFMASTGAKWGNEFTMQVYGKNSFTEEDYFPIESSGDYIKRSEDAALSKRSDFARILHISATKGLTEGANNPIMIRDIFTVFQDHISDMMAMNAFGVPVLDTIKWLNYQERVRLETGQVDMKSIRSSMESAYGEDAVKYVESFLKDVNGTEKAGRGEDFFSKWASKYKIASVGFNSRVGLLQISAFPRAALEVEARYLRNGVKLLANFKDGKFHGIRENAFRAAADEMLKYSGIALYKDLGFREINIGPSERKMLTDVDPTSRIDFYKKRFFTKEGISENAMWLAEKMDKFTWSAIWMACKAKTAAETNLRGEALLKETAKFFDRLCVKTQVFDSPIAKSQIMRSKSGLVKSVTSFMAEPITSYNAVLRAYDQISEAKRLGKKLPIKNFVSAVSVCTASMLFGAIVESIMDVPRDDDDYETKWEKFMQALVGDGSLEGFFLDSNLGSGMNPLNYIPYARDAVSALSGYENSDMTTAWMYESVKALKEIAEIWRVKNGFQEDYTKITYYGKKTEYGVIYDSLKALSHATGAPLSNLSRDLISMWNTTIGTAHPDLKVKTYEPSQETAIQEAFEAGNLTREEALEKLQEKVTDKDGNAISQDDAYWKLRSWETGSSSKLHTLTGALIAGDPEGIQEAKQELLAHGYETGDMDSVFTSSIGELYKKDADGNYGNGRISRKQAEKYLRDYTAKSEKEISQKLEEWDYAIKNGTTEGFSVYDNLHSAIDSGKNISGAINDYLSKGYKSESLARQITTDYRETFVQLWSSNQGQAEELMDKLLDAYEALGYSRSKKREDILDWLEES